MAFNRNYVVVVVLISAPVLVFSLSVHKTYVDVTGYQPDWAKNPFIDASAVCQDHDELDNYPHVDRYWCAEYLNYILYGDEPFYNFTDITGYTARWDPEITITHILTECDYKVEFPGSANDQEAYWCAEYAGYIHDGSADADGVNFADSTRYAPDWTRAMGEQQAETICLNIDHVSGRYIHRDEICLSTQYRTDHPTFESLTTSQRSCSGPDRYWCAEYLGYLQDRDGPGVVFADITGYTPDWASGDRQATAACQSRSQYNNYLSGKADVACFPNSDTIMHKDFDYCVPQNDRYWCAEYLAHQDGGNMVDFVDSTGYIPGWIAGAYQTNIICQNRHNVLSDGSQVDRYWCAEYLNHVRYGQEIAAPFDGFVDITGHTPDWTAPLTMIQVMSTCDNPDDLVNDTDDRDRYWCDEYIGSLDNLPYEYHVDPRFSYVPDWPEQMTLRQVEAVCKPKSDDYCESVRYRHPACTKRIDMTSEETFDTLLDDFDNPKNLSPEILEEFRTISKFDIFVDMTDDNFWCGSYRAHLHEEGLSPPQWAVDGTYGANKTAWADFLTSVCRHC